MHKNNEGESATVKNVYLGESEKSTNESPKGA